VPRYLLTEEEWLGGSLEGEGAGVACGERAIGTIRAQANVTDIAIASLLCCTRAIVKLITHANNTICWFLHTKTPH
jgi:hypothetical protein